MVLRNTGRGLIGVEREEGEKREERKGKREVREQCRDCKIITRIRERSQDK